MGTALLLNYHLDLVRDIGVLELDHLLLVLLREENGKEVMHEVEKVQVEVGREKRGIVVVEGGRGRGRGTSILVPLEVGEKAIENRIGIVEIGTGTGKETEEIEVDLTIVIQGEVVEVVLKFLIDNEVIPGRDRGIVQMKMIETMNLTVVVGVLRLDQYHRQIIEEGV